jgi:hypothetical protein
MERIERSTSPLPRECSTTELHGRSSTAACSNVIRSLTGAGEGNRTLVVSLEGFCSTIELHPLFPPSPCPTLKPYATLCLAGLPCPESRQCPNPPMPEFANSLPESANFLYWWRGKDSNLRRHGRQIYSLLPLTAREPLRTKLAILARKPLPVKRFACPGEASTGRGNLGRDRQALALAVLLQPRCEDASVRPVSHHARVLDMRGGR